MSLLAETLLLITGVALLVIFLLALLSPFESLGWWAGWSQRELGSEFKHDPAHHSPSDIDTRPSSQAPADRYVVYLSGILAFSGEMLGNRELALMEAIAARLPGDEAMIGDVFPYSVNNNPLNGERYLAALFQWLKDHQKRLKNPANAYNWLILIRNLFHVAVSADPRYGPINNTGLAVEIVRSLVQHGYPLGSAKPVYLIGYSGGGQMAIGAARYLRLVLDAPIYVIGLGGFFSDDRGLDSVEHLYQILGSKDFFPSVAGLLFPGHWPLLPYSSWNRLRRQGRYTRLTPGPLYHFGARDYFSRSASLPDGETYAEATARLAAQAILGVSDRQSAISPS